MIAGFIVLASLAEPEPGLLPEPPLVEAPAAEAEPAAAPLIPPAHRRVDHSDGGARFGASLLGAAIATGVSGVIAGIAFPIAWLVEGPQNDKLGKAGLDAAVVGGMALACLLPWLAERFHSFAGGEGTYGAAWLGLGIGATLALIAAGVATGIWSQQPVAAPILVALASPMPYMGLALGLEAGHRTVFW